MRLRKRIISAILSTCMAVTLVPANMPLRAMAAEETTVPEVNEEEGAIPVALETDKAGNEDVQENNIITDVTISDTYYSIDGQFPMYVEYKVSSNDVTRENLKLTVTKSSGETVAEGVSSDSYKNYFYIKKCNGVNASDKLELDFSISYNDTISWKNKKTISFVNMDIAVNPPYISTGKAENRIDIGFLNQSEIDNREYSIYLFDENDKIAAGTKKDVTFSSSISEKYCPRYQGIFTINDPDFISDAQWFYNNNVSLYRTRELKTGEKLYLGYRYSGEKDITIAKDVTVTVTDQPYIRQLYFDNGSNYLDSGMDTEMIRLSGNNVDFSKLSFELKDKDTGELAGKSVSYVKRYNDEAYYCVQWENGKKPIERTTYQVEFHYFDNETSVISKENFINYYNSTDDNIIYNYKTNSIEYYNREIPAGSAVSYELKDGYGSNSSVVVSGAGIKVDSNNLLTVELSDISLGGTYYLHVTYVTYDGAEEKAYRYLSISNYIPGAGGSGISSSVLENRYYLSNNENFEFSAGLYCDNESKLLDVCNAEISKSGSSDFETKTIELALKKENKKLLYTGTYQGKLEVGRYELLFSPDGNSNFGYSFYVYDSNKLSIDYQNNSINSGIVSIGFSSSEITGWYCGTDNSKIQDKLAVKVLDIERKEIGTYKASNGDFTITGDTRSTTYRIQFSDKIKQELSNMYYCYVHLYYDDMEVFSSYNPEKCLYDYEPSYEEYIYQYGNIVNIYMARIDGYSVEAGYYYDYGYYRVDLNGVDGTDSSFPVKVTVADWYSIKPIKIITVQKPRDIFTKSQFEGLSSNKVYNFFLEGADGSASWARGYLADAEEDKPEPTPTPYNPGNNNGYIPGPGANNSGYIPGPSVQPTIEPTVEPTIEPTVEPTAEPTVEPTVQPTVEPTVQPTAEPTIQPTAAPTVQPTVEPTVQPTATPEQSDAPEEKGKLKLKKNKITLTKGQKTTIKITSELNTSVTYKSLKPSVATVNKKGVVTAKKAGTAVITVKANGQVKKVKVTVKGTKKVVKNSSSVKLGKNFKLSKKSVTLKKGKKFTIQKASGLSGKVTFRSLDKKIASVSVNGVVKARKKGKTTILIKRGKKTIKLKVTVKK